LPSGNWVDERLIRYCARCIVEVVDGDDDEDNDEDDDIADAEGYVYSILRQM